MLALGGQRRRTGMSSAVGRSVSVRTLEDWNDSASGDVRVDFVAHSDASSSSSIVQTTVLNDIATGWTECIPSAAAKATWQLGRSVRAKSSFHSPSSAWISTTTALS